MQDKVVISIIVDAEAKTETAEQKIDRLNKKINERIKLEAKLLGIQEKSIEQQSRSFSPDSMHLMGAPGYEDHKISSSGSTASMDDVANWAKLEATIISVASKRVRPYMQAFIDIAESGRDIIRAGIGGADAASAYFDTMERDQNTKAFRKKTKATVWENTQELALEKGILPWNINALEKIGLLNQEQITQLNELEIEGISQKRDAEAEQLAATIIGMFRRILVSATEHVPYLLCHPSMAQACSNE